MCPQPVRLLLLLIIILNLSIVSASFAQNCGQRDTIVFVNNSSGSIDLTISDYFNDDLSDPMQGLCGIEIGFVHQFVENLEVSITSPAGQTVNLIGPNGDDALDFTLGTQWDISFVPCLETAQPDSPFAQQWDNEQSENWVNFGNYTGSYYPFQGCLEDFDTGPVNGTWTFDINNDPSNNPGAITYLRLIFCDSRGVECCFTEAGQWVNEDILTCLGNDTLLINPQINYPTGIADTLEYDYAYLISNNGIYQQLDSVIDLRNADAGIYDICGFSYLRVELDSLPLPDGNLTIDSIRSNLTGLEPWLCAELTPECLRIEIVAPPDTTRLDERICAGDSIVIGNMPFFDNGSYTVDLSSEAGCDSIVTLDLFVQEVEETFLTEIICPGDSFVIGTIAYFETGIYLDTLPTVELGCDSIVQLDLTMLSDLLIELDSVICIGDQIQVGDSIFQNTGNYQVLLESSRGCDSLVRVDLTVLDPEAQITGVQTLNCQTTSIILDGENMGTPGTFSYRWLDDSNTELGLSPTQLVDQEGNYFLELTQTFNGVSCQNRDTVFIGSNFNIPIADAGPDTAITCQNETIDIGGPTTSTGINFVYEWQTTNGLLTPPSDQSTLSVNTAGDYQLIVRDTFSFCADTAFVNVADQTSLPDVLFASGFTLNCQLLQDTLDGSASLSDPAFTANWSGPCINATLAPAIVTVDCPGWYILEVENTLTGCVNSDSILIEEQIDPAIATIASSANILNCNVPQIELDASTSSPDGLLTFEWEGPGTSLPSQAQITVGQAGSYQLIVTRTDNFCRDTAMILIAQDTLSPAADAGLDTAITCRNEIIDIGGPTTSTGSNFVYEWQTTNGLLTPPSDQPTLSVNTAGDYQLIVRDTFSFCADTAFVNVADQTGLPDVLFADGFTLNCQLLQDTLDGSASLSDPNFLANWSGPCINATLAPAIVTVDCPGWYILEVENTFSGCVNRDSILIEEDIDPAVAAIAPLTDILNCNIPQLELNASASSPNGLLAFEWEGPGAPLADQAQVLVEQAGSYQLIVTRTDNFCRDTATILVTQDTLAPMADAGSDLELNCNSPSSYTQGTNSSTGSTISYQWFSNNTLLPSEMNDSLNVTTAGIYILEVTDSNNGCISRDTINATEDFFPPELVQAGPDAPLNCAGDIVFLTPDSTGFSRPVNWTWDGPCFTTPTDTWTVATDCPGLYTLTVINQGNGCPASDVVMVTTSSNFSQAILADETLSLDCDTGNATLNTTGSIGSIFQWFRDDLLISLPNNSPIIDQAGMYTLVTSDASMVCSDTARTEVIIDCPVLAVIALPDTLNCRQNSILLSASGSTLNGAVTYQWAGPNAGCFVDDPQQAEVTVVCPGSYQVILEQTLFGLRDTAFVEVLIDTITPVVNAGENLQVSCTVPVPTLTGSVIGNPDDYSFAWTNFSGTDTLSFTSDFSTSLPGSYFFVAENNSNGCTSQDIAQITLNNVEIDIAFGSSIFPCLTDTFRLEAFVSPAETSYLYQWTGPGIVSDADSLDALINTIGEYIFTVENPLNGCNQTDTIMVTDQTCAPCLDLPAADTLNCLSNDLLISASFCATCNNCTLQWSDEGGPISGATSLDLNVNTAGQYTIVATDLLGFSSSAIVEVFDLTTPPLLDLGPDLILTCDSTNYTLQNQLLNNSPNLQYQWSLLDGTIINNTDSTVVVDIEDTYILNLTNTLSSCSIADTINITQDIETPEAEAGLNQQLTCENNIVLLDGSASTLANATYAWTGPAGCIAGEQTTTPIASCEGLYFLQVTLNRNGCTAQDSVTVTQNEALPVIIPIPDTLINCLQPSVILEGNSPNTDGYSVSWCALDEMGNAILSSCDTFLNYTATIGGDYQFTVVNDTTLCSNTYTLSVAVDSLLPFVDAGLTDTLRCDVSSLMLNGNVDTETSFIWTGPTDANIVPSNSLTPTVDITGWYYLSATSNNNGCSAVDSVQIVLDENVPMLDAGVDTLLNCSNTTIELNATGSTNSGNAEWQWTTQTGTIIGAANTPNLMVTDSAWYIVTLLDPTNSCSQVDSVFVGLDYSQPLAMVNGIDTLTCAQDTLLLDASTAVSSSGQGLNYAWQVINGQLFPDLGTDQVFTDRPGTYQLIVEDVGNGCLDTLRFDIESNIILPDLTLAVPDSLACNIDSVLLQTTVPATEVGFAFEWNYEDGTLISEDYMTYAFEPGRYYLLLEAENNGCTRLDSIDVFARDDSPVVNIATPLPLACTRSSVTLDASASSSGANLIYEWSSLSGNSLLGPANGLIDSTAHEGTYQLLITDSTTGCQQLDSVEVINNSNPIFGALLEVVPPPCDGGSSGQEQGSISIDSVYGGTPPYLYSINNEPFEPLSFFEDLPVGSYQIRIRDIGNCVWTESAGIQRPIATILDLGPDIELELGDSVQLIPQFSQTLDSFYWESFGLFPNTETLRPTISPRETQFVLLTVIDENGCTASDTLRIFVDDDIDLYIPNAFSPNADGENDLFTVYGGPEVVRVRSLRIFSRWGNMVYERLNFLPNDPNKGWDGTLWGEKLNPGVFVYQVEVQIEGRGVRVITGEVLLMR